ncbi:MAG: hypothetical protein HY907_06305 [Deltaproteobacteria bacterium]|nr:hypothetical protein [Deltaproteobacteria bacterium]
MPRPHRCPVARIATLSVAALLAAACAKKENRRETPPPTPAAAPESTDTESQTGPAERHTTHNAPAAGQEADGRPLHADVPPAALPSESSAGGAAVWITAPNLSRTIDRVLALVERHRDAGGELLAQLPAGPALRDTVEQLLRGGLFAEVLGLGDPAAVDLSQPVRVRLSFPATGAPMAVVSLGTTRPLEPARSGKLVGLPTRDGRYLVGIGVEPDAATAWPADPPGPAAQDLVARIAVGTALPAIVKALGDLKTLAVSMSGSEPMPPWVPEVVGGLARFAVDVSGIDDLSLGLLVGASPQEAPLRMTLGLRPRPDAPTAAAFAMLSQGAPPFGLLDTIDAGGDAWIAARMSPAGIRALLDAIATPTERFLGQALPEDWHPPVLDAFRAAVELMAGGDGRIVGATRTLAGGRNAFSFVWGVGAGQTEAVRAASRKFGTALADVLRRLSDKFSFGATVTWTEAAARSGDVDVDRLSIVIPRAALGPVAAMLQPGDGDLRWDVSVAVGPSLAVWTSDPDPSVIQRALASRARGGGAAAGTPPAERLANADADLLELAWMDMAAAFRDNPAMSCPPGTSFPPLPIQLEVRAAAGGIEADIDFLPGGADPLFPFLKAVAACVPPKPPIGP